ncbi:hypothetical protein ARMGADRAFT_1078449 [Armillaria gallica]|uniref:Uncharacterized protein n=1 Tax=Armillaria gallica TaxID=47427 RepID=A0A2H3DH73_ARMGA|nr:hypothetical protein ARMGADRAFT_1078449 [Armillaria gallica]
MHQWTNGEQTKRAQNTPPLCNMGPYRSTQLPYQSQLMHIPFSVWHHESVVAFFSRSPPPSQGAVYPCLYLFSTWDDDPVADDSHHPVSTIPSVDHSTSSGGGMALPTLLQEMQSSGEVDIGRYRYIELINGSVNVIGVSDILIAASRFISCSIPGTTCRRSGMMITKLDCAFEWYVHHRWFVNEADVLSKVSTNLTLSSKPSLSKLVSLFLKPVFLRPAYPGKTLYFPYSDVSSSSERGEWERQQCVGGQTETRRAIGEEINFDRPAVSTLCNHARLPQLTHQGSQCPRDVGIPALQASYLKSGPVFQCVATTSE